MCRKLHGLPFARSRASALVSTSYGGAKTSAARPVAGRKARNGLISVKRVSVTAGEFSSRRCYQGRKGEMMTTKVVLIAGPTASGKSALALEVAEQFGGVIINADSMQVYRDLRIITARP